jgi:uncharacterized protein (UPF0297 family)
MIPFEEWDKAYDDEEISVRKDPHGEDEYAIMVKEPEGYIQLPRGTLREIAKSSREHGKNMLSTLMGYRGPVAFFNREQQADVTLAELTYDSLIAACGKAYLSEEERYANVDLEELL